MAEEKNYLSEDAMGFGAAPKATGYLSEDAMGFKPKEPGFAARLGQGASRALDSAKTALTDDPNKIAKIAADQARTALPQTPLQQQLADEFKPYVDAANKAEGFVDNVTAWGTAGLKRAGQLLSNPAEAGKMIAEQLPNSLPGIAGGFAGAKAGAALGSLAGPVGTAVGGVLGGVAGGFAGSYGLEKGAAMQEQVQQEAQKRKIDIQNQEAVAGMVAQKQPEFEATAQRKGVGTAGTDAILNVATMGLAGIGGRAIAKEAQALHAAVKGGAMDAAEASTRLAALESAQAARNTLGAKALRGTGVVGAEMVGEGLSEAVGQQYAYGQIDAGQVIDESLLGLGSGGAMALGSKTFNKAAGIVDQDATTQRLEAARAEIEKKLQSIPEHQQPAARAQLNAEMNAQLQAEARAAGLLDEEQGPPDVPTGNPSDYRATPAWAKPPEDAAPDYASADDEIFQSTGTPQRVDPVREAVRQAADAGGSLSAAAGVAMDSGAAPTFMPPADQAPQPTADATPQGPVILGADSVPLGSGGTPFRTKYDAAAAKKMQPLMRVIKVDGGYALAEKTPAQIAAQEKAGQRLAQPRTSAGGEPIPAHAFIASSGGISRAAAPEVGLDQNPMVGNRFLLSSTGMSMEEATQRLIEEGYLGQGAGINDALALIKTSLSNPQYTPEGFERIAQAQSEARFNDYLEAHEDAAQNASEDYDPFAPGGDFGLPDGFTPDDLVGEGYTTANPGLQLEVNALMSQLEDMGFDPVDALGDTVSNYANATQDEFNAAARQILQGAIASSSGNGGRAAAQAAPTPAGAGSAAAAQELTEPTPPAAMPVPGNFNGTPSASMGARTDASAGPGFGPRDLQSAIAQIRAQKQQVAQEQPTTPTQQGFTDGTQADQTQQGSAQPAQTQQADAPGAVERHPTWRQNAIQAGRVARALGLEPKGKRLAQIVAEIDARDSEQNQPVAPANPAQAATENVALDALERKTDEVMANVVAPGSINLTRGQVRALIQEKGVAAADKAIADYQEHIAKQAESIRKYSDRKEAASQSRQAQEAIENVADQPPVTGGANSGGVSSLAAIRASIKEREKFADLQQAMRKAKWFPEAAEPDNTIWTRVRNRRLYTASLNPDASSMEITVPEAGVNVQIASFSALDSADAAILANKAIAADIAERAKESGIKRSNSGYAEVKMHGSKHFVTPYNDLFVIRDARGVIAKTPSKQQMFFATEAEAIEFANENAAKPLDGANGSADNAPALTSYTPAEIQSQQQAQESKPNQPPAQQAPAVAATKILAPDMGAGALKFEYPSLVDNQQRKRIEEWFAAGGDPATKPAERGIYLPGMSVGKLERLIAKESPTAKDVESLKDYKYLLLAQQNDAAEKGFMTRVTADHGGFWLPKNKFWLTNIDQAIDRGNGSLRDAPSRPNQTLTQAKQAQAATENVADDGDGSQGEVYSTRKEAIDAGERSGANYSVVPLDDRGPKGKHRLVVDSKEKQPQGQAQQDASMARTAAQRINDAVRMLQETRNSMDALVAMHGDGLDPDDDVIEVIQRAASGFDAPEKKKLNKFLKENTKRGKKGTYITNARQLFDLLPEHFGYNQWLLHDAINDLSNEAQNQPAARTKQEQAATENVAEAIPIFERYDDAMAWMKDRAKSQGLSVIAYRATDEFKNALSPQLQALYAASKSKWDADTAEAGKAMQDAMAKAGIRPGDTVQWNQPGAFLTTQKLSGVVKLDRLGVPHVHMSSEVAVAKAGGKIGYTKKLRWQPYMQKPAESASQAVTPVDDAPRRADTAATDSRPAQEATAAEQQKAAPAAEPAAEQGLNQPSAPAKLELSAQTPAEAAAQQDAQEQAAKAEAAAKRAADAAAKAEEERKRIAQASVRAADSFELGQDPLDSLTGQGSIFDAPEQAAPAQPDTPKLTQDEAKSLMAWEDLGQKNGVKTHALTFYESQADKDAKRGRMIVARVTKEVDGRNWMVEGTEEMLAVLGMAKKKAEQVGMARVVADGYVEQGATAPKTTAKPAATTTTGAPIEDAGEKIGGARKDRWKERGLNLEDLDAMTEAEGAELATKSNVWKPDYEALSAQSEPVTAAMVKTIYDQLAAKPKNNTPEGRRQYVQMMRIVRDVLTDAKGPEAVKNAYVEIRKRAGMNTDSPQAKSAARDLLFSVYKGRSDPFVLGYNEVTKAKKLVEGGFPAKGEPWKSRLTVGQREGGNGTTERGIELYLELSAEVGTPLTREQIEAGFFRVKDKKNKTVAFAPTKEDAEAAAKTVYERDMKGGKDDKPEPVRPNLDELKRENLPQRIDRDVTADDFVRDLGFRGIEFGNWSAQDERQRILNMAYDGLTDLAQIMGVPPKAMSLNGTLGMAFGARGGGRFAAHYEPGKLVINMTKIRGGGSMAHEWAHAMDHYFGELDKPDAYTTQARGASGWLSEDQYKGVPRKRMERVGNEWKSVEKMRLDNLRPEMAAAFDEVMRALFQKQITKAEMVRSHELDLERTEALAAKEQDADMKAMYTNMAENRRQALEELRQDPEDRMYDGRGRSDYASQAQALSGKSENGYWTRPTEMFARAFESWVFDKVTAMGARSDYLVHGVEEDRFAGGGYRGNPYPTGEERARINAAFDKLASTVKTKETDKGVALYYASTAPTRPGSAQDKAVMQAIADGKNARDVLRLIASGSKDPFLRQVAKMLLKAGITPNIEFGHIGKTKNGTPIYGQYRGKTDTIAIAGSAEYAAERIFMHEAMHAATMRALAKPGLPSLQLRKLLAHVQKQKGAVGFYGMQNVDEFVAEVFTNPDFQNALRGMSAPAGNSLKSAWDSFVRILRGILGLPNDSLNALSQALELGVEAVRQDMVLRKQGAQAGRNANAGRDAIDQTETEKFKRWFKDSKVVDADGKPLVVYHGTSGNEGGDAFTYFDAYASNYGLMGQGAYFTDNPEVASSYTTKGKGETPTVYKVFLSIQNPIDMDAKADPAKWQKQFDGIEDFHEGGETNESWYRAAEDLLRDQGLPMWEGAETMQDGLRAMGFDGITHIGGGRVKSDGVRHRVYIAFEPTQVKSATGNNGNFDPEDPDIRNFGMDDIRNAINERKTVIAGQTSRAYTQQQQAAMRNVGLMVEQPSLKERAQALWQDAGKKLAQGIVDQFAPVKEISKYAYALLRLSKGASGAFETLLKGGKLKLSGGVYDFDEANKGGVVDALLTPLNGEHHDFLRWVAANRAERLMGEDRERLFTPDDIAALKTLADGQLSSDFTLKNGPRKGQITRSRAEAYKDSLTTFNAFHKNVLDMTEQSGLIDPDSRATWESEFYVPFYRVADEESGGVRGMNIKGSVVRQQAFKHLKGGKQALNNDLLDNTLMNWAHLLDASAKNRAAKATLEAAQQVGVAIEAPKGTLDNIASAIGKKNGIVWFMDEGQKRHFMVDDPYIMTAISSLEYAGMNSPIMNAMSAFKHALTIGVTASPFFKIRNLIRDSVQVVGTSSIGVNPLKNVAEGWKLTDPKNDAYFRLLAGGGTIHFGTMLEGSEAKRVQALVESGVQDSTILSTDHKVKQFYRKYIEPGITAYNELGNRGEAVNRAALYDQLRKQGMGHAEASLQARDLMDFSMQGSFTSIRFLSQVVPFLNARLQGMYKLGRAANENPKRMAYVTGAVAMASLALLAAYGDDDDWKRREDWDRNNFWWFKVGGVAFRIPKPFELGAIGTLAERSAEYLMDDEMTGKRFRGQVLKLLGDNLSMNPIPQAVKPILDVYANKDSFRNAPIESMGMERMKSEYRFNDRTSMVARGLSTAANSVTGLVGAESLSPVQIDHLLRGYFGWLGTFAVGTADMIARPVTNQPTQATQDIWKKVTGGIVSELQDAPSRYVSSVYDQAKELEQAFGTWRALQKSGKPEEAAAFFADNREEIARYRSVTQVKSAESKLNERIRQIERNEAMDGDQKREEIRRIRAMKEALAKQLAPA